MKAPPCAFNEIVGKIGALTLEVRTPLPAEELEARLMAFFGAGGLGLGWTSRKRQQAGCASGAAGGT